MFLKPTHIERLGFYAGALRISHIADEYGNTVVGIVE